MQGFFTLLVFSFIVEIVRELTQKKNKEVSAVAYDEAVSAVDHVS